MANATANAASSATANHAHSPRLDRTRASRSQAVTRPDTAAFASCPS
jgi:hypothetical protein